MTVANQESSTQDSARQDIINLGQNEQRISRGFWIDSWRRLRRNKFALLGLVIIITIIFISIFAEQIAPYTAEEQDILARNTAPQWVIDLFPTMNAVGTEGGYITVNEQYTLGTDSRGRDILSRILYGGQISLAVAFIGPFVSMIVGLLLGLLSGYIGGQFDNIMMRFVDIMYAFPTLLFIILLMSFFRASADVSEEGTFVYQVTQIDAQFGGMLFIFIGIGLTSWMNVARLTRGQVLSIREQEYITAARSIGVPQFSIIRRHVLPNILGPIIVAETLTIPTYISYEAFLSFIGLGVQRPTPSWGSMISDGADAISTYPYQALFPAAALFLIMFAFNFLGDGLRDALDPRVGN